jgi:hypothetical protein
MFLISKDSFSDMTTVIELPDHPCCAILAVSENGAGGRVCQIGS